MRFVVIGASAAGITAVQKLRECRPDAEITLISKDTAVYSKCILYHFLDQTRTLEEMNFAGLDFDSRLNIRWMKGTSAESVDIEKKTVHTDQGVDVPYDKLCIAAGSHTNFPPIPGLREGKNIVGFRTLDDAVRIRERAEKAEHIFIMGAGLVGIDVAAGLLDYGKKICLADMGPYMMPLQLDEYAAGVYQKLFARRGVSQHYGVGVKEFVLDNQGNCCRVILGDGTAVPADLVINCAGVRANVEFLRDSGIACDKYGLVIDAYGQTNAEDVYGAGDVTGRNTVWPAAVREGMTAAYSMTGNLRETEDYFTVKSSMYFLGVPTVSAGQVNNYEDDCQELVRKENGSYLKIVSKDGIIIGALLQGDLSGAGQLMEAVRLGEPVSKMSGVRASLL